MKEQADRRERERQRQHRASCHKSIAGSCYMAEIALLLNLSVRRVVKVRRFD